MIIKRKRLIWLGCSLVGILILWMWLWPSGDKAPRFLTAVVSVRDIERTVIATGVLEAQRQVSVGAQASGQIRALHVDFGDSVKKGDLIAEIDSITQKNALANARADLARIEAQRSAKQANLKQAQLLFNRQKDLLAKRAISREDYEAAEATFAVAEAETAALDAQIEQARIQVSTAEANLGYTRITAPMDGTVVAVLVKEGQTVNAAQQTPTLVKIANLDQMTIKAEISEADVIHVKAGQKVYFTILGDPAKRYYGTLRAIEPAPTSINSETSTSSAVSSSSSTNNTAIYYNALFDVPNPDGRLRISMTAQVSIILADAQNVLTVPTAALGERQKDGSQSVQVLTPAGEPEIRMVRTGVDDGVNSEVLEGLTADEQVILGDSTLGSSTPPRRGAVRF